MENKKIVLKDQYLLKTFRKILEEKYSLNKYEEYLNNQFRSFIRMDEENHYLSILNSFYLEENQVDMFSKLQEEGKEKEFLEKEFPSLLKMNDDLKTKYYVRLDSSNVKPNQFVQNGSLVFKIQRVLDFNMDIHLRLQKIKELESYSQLIEKELGAILNIPIRILFQDILIPPKTTATN